MGRDMNRDAIFVRYDDTGKIIQTGSMSRAFIQAEIDAGKKTLIVSVQPPVDGSYVVRDGVVVPRD